MRETSALPELLKRKTKSEWADTSPEREFKEEMKQGFPLPEEGGGNPFVIHLGTAVRPVQKVRGIHLACTYDRD